MKYRIDQVNNGKTYIEADRYMTLAGGLVVFEREKKAPTGSVVLLPEGLKDQGYEVVLVLSPFGFASFEPIPNA